MPVTNSVESRPVAARNAVSSTPTDLTPSSRPWVVDQRPAVVAHRPHDGVPADAVLNRDRRHVVAVLTDPPAGLHAGPRRSMRGWRSVLARR
jgi:hypothetical protein